MWRYGFAVLLLLGLMSSAARAEESVTEMLKEYDAADADGRHAIEMRVEYTDDGLYWANKYTAHRDGEFIYCAPDKYAAPGNETIALLRQEVKAHPDSGELPIGYAILAANIRRFPCHLVH